MPRRSPYGSEPADVLAFLISLPVRRWVLMYAARTGQVHARDLLREFPDYGDRHAAAEVLHVLRDKGFLVAAGKVPDVVGKPDQLIYTITPLTRSAVRELSALVEDLALEVEE